MTALQCPNCGQLLRVSDYPDEAKIDRCVYCGVIFANGINPRVLGKNGIEYQNPFEEHMSMQRNMTSPPSAISTISGREAQNMLARNIEALGMGFEYDYLADREFEKFKLGFRRGFDRPQIIDNFIKHILDILLGCMIAKKQFGEEFDGSQPYGGRFGYGLIMPNHMGRDLWYIDNHNDYINIRVGDSMVVVITGFMDAVGGGGIRQIRFAVDERKKIWLSTQPSFASGEIMDIDEAIILKKGTTFSLEYRPRETTRGQLQPVGVTFLPEHLMRETIIGPQYGMVTDLKQTYDDLIKAGQGEYMALVERYIPKKSHSSKKAAK
jgi:hypothetical protein